MNSWNIQIRQLKMCSFLGNQSGSVGLLNENEENLECITEDWDDEYLLQPWF